MQTQSKGLDDLPPGFAPAPSQQLAGATAALPSSANQLPGSTAVLQGAAAVGRGLSRHPQPGQEAHQQRRQQEASTIAELPPGFATPAKQEHPANQGNTFWKDACCLEIYVAQCVAFGSMPTNAWHSISM